MEREEIIDGLIEVLKTVRMIEPEKLVGVTEETDFLDAFAAIEDPNTYTAWLQYHKGAEKELIQKINSLEF